MKLICECEENYECEECYYANQDRCTCVDGEINIYCEECFV